MTTSGVDLVLSEARTLLAQGWCQGANAETAGGAPVEPWNASAKRWSASGALVGGWQTLYKPNNGSPADDALAEAMSALGAEIGDPEAWNDAPDRSQGDVLDMFDRLIERAGSSTHQR